MRCGKCGTYTPGYNCSHCSRAKSRGKPKPLDVALKKLEQMYRDNYKEKKTDERHERFINEMEAFNESKNDKADSVSPDSKAVPGGESKDPVESD